MGETPTYLILVYPGQGGLVVTQTSNRTIRLDGCKHTPWEDWKGYAAENLSLIGTTTRWVSARGDSTAPLLFDQFGACLLKNRRR